MSLGNENGSPDDFNPLAPRGARQMRNYLVRAAYRYFNPLAPRGARPVVECDNTYKALFQSTSSSRSQTYNQVSYCVDKINFNPLAPRGARQQNRPISVLFQT